MGSAVSGSYSAIPPTADHQFAHRPTRRPRTQGGLSPRTLASGSLLQSPLANAPGCPTTGFLASCRTLERSIRRPCGPASHPPTRRIRVHLSRLGPSHSDSRAARAGFGACTPDPEGRRLTKRSSRRAHAVPSPRAVESRPSEVFTGVLGKSPPAAERRSRENGGLQARSRVLNAMGSSILWAATREDR